MNKWESILHAQKKITAILIIEFPHSENRIFYAWIPLFRWPWRLRVPEVRSMHNSVWNTSFAEPTIVPSSLSIKVILRVALYRSEREHKHLWIATHLFWAELTCEHISHTNTVPASAFRTFEMQMSAHKLAPASFDFVAGSHTQPWHVSCM